MSSLQLKWDLSKIGFTSIDNPHFLALYKVAYCIAKAMKPHTLAEEVIKPCDVDMAVGDGGSWCKGDGH